MCPYYITHTQKCTMLLGLLTYKVDVYGIPHKDGDKLTLFSPIGFPLVDPFYNIIFQISPFTTPK